MKIASIRLYLYGMFLCCILLVLYSYRSLVLAGKLKSIDRTVNDTHQYKDSTEIIDPPLEIPSVELTEPNRRDIKDECQAVVEGDVKRLVALRKRKGFPWKDGTTDEQVLRVAQNCTDLRKRYRFPPFFNPNVTDEELHFPIAYTILAHKCVNQILILLSAIYRKHNIHCIHLDKKSPRITFLALKQAMQCFPNVTLSSERIKVYYGHASRLKADIVCMKDMVQNHNVEWKYLINLCSQDFPIKTNLEIVRELKKLQGHNSIQGQLVIDKRTKRRTEFVHKLMAVVKRGSRGLSIRRTGRKNSPPPYNMTVVKNSAYNIYTREFLQWALLDSKVGQALLKWSENTYTPDEHFWLMLHLHPNAPGGSHKPSLPLARGVVWMIAPRAECHGQTIHGICVLGAEDIRQAVRWRRLLVNKFDITNDSSGPVCTRRLLDERSTAPHQDKSIAKHTG